MTRSGAKQFISVARQQVRQLEGYVNTGDDYKLREMCLHAIRWLISECKKLCKQFGLFTDIERFAY